MNKTFYANSVFGTVVICNTGTPYVAVYNPMSYISSINFHTGLPYLQFLSKTTMTSFTVPAVTRAIITWDDSTNHCCFIMLEARYGNGTMDSVVRRYRDEYLTPKNSRGYYKLAEVLVPLMRSSKLFKWLITKTFADPLVSYGKYHYGLNKHGWIFKPVKNFWFNIFDILGSDTEFIQETGKII